MSFEEQPAIPPLVVGEEYTEETGIFLMRDIVSQSSFS